MRCGAPATWHWRRGFSTPRPAPGCSSARGPASGHRSDPDWRPTEDDLDDEVDDDSDDETDGASQRSVVVAAAVIDTEPDYLDVDVIEEDAGALPVGESAAEQVDEAEESEN